MVKTLSLLVFHRDVFMVRKGENADVCPQRALTQWCGVRAGQEKGEAETMERKSSKALIVNER